MSTQPTRMNAVLRAAALALLAFAGTAAANPVEGARQLVVVTTDGWDSTAGQLQSFERGASGWQATAEPFAVALGRSGSAWGIGLHPARVEQDGPRKVEGDGRSPAGVFALGTAFGAAANARTGLPYQPMQETSYCMDVPDSPYYNRIVDAGRVGAEAVAGSTEPMRLDLQDPQDVRYRQGFVVAHNPRNEPGKGSCIFAHLWREPGEATAGCTAMPGPRMAALLQWLKADQQPRFVLLPRADYLRLQAQWQLPPLPDVHGSAL